MHARPRIINIAKFLDRDGAVLHIPTKPRTQRALRGYLISRFEAGREYSETEVSELLAPLAGRYDAIVLRRLLIDGRELCRNTGSARYWVAEEPETVGWTWRIREWKDET